MFLNTKSLDLLALFWQPCSWEVKNVFAGIAGTRFSMILHIETRQSFAPLLESWEVMLVDEIHYQARFFWTIVPSYEWTNEACCVLPKLFHRVNVLLDVRVPDDGFILQEWLDELVSISFEGCWAVPEIPMKESQDAVCFLCDGVDVSFQFS